MTERIAVLIDAENISHNMIDDLFEKLSNMEGDVIFKRAFGNWSKDSLKDMKWQNILSENAIVPEHIFDFTKKKNAADIQLVIYAMKLMYTKEIDTFVLVTSDSDFTPLAYILKENNKKVLGFGSNTYSRSFKNACDSFEVLKTNNVEPKLEKKNKEEVIVTELPKNFLIKVWNSGKNKLTHNGFLNFDSANAIARDIVPSFNAKRFGYSSFRDLVEQDGRFDLDSKDRDNHVEMFMKLKDHTSHITNLLNKVLKHEDLKFHDKNWIPFESAGFLLKTIENDFSAKKYGFKNFSSLIESVDGYTISNFEIDGKEEYCFKKT